MRKWSLSFTAVFAILVAFGGCGGSSPGGGPGAGAEVAFHGEQQAFPDFNYDTGYQPASSPVQLKLVLAATGKLTVDAKAVPGGSSDAPTLTGEKGGGQFVMDVHFTFKVLMNFDIPGAFGTPGFKKMDVELMNLPDLDVKFGGMTTFDPFLVGDKATITTTVPDTDLATIPLAGALSAVPGITGNLVITVGGTVTSEFSGVCAAISKGPSAMAHYTGQTATSGMLQLKPKLDVSLLVFNMTITPTLPPVPIPAATFPMDLGTKPVTGGGSAAMGGGSMAMPGTCEGASPGGDGGVGPDGSAQGPDGGPGGPDASGGVDQLGGIDVRHAPDATTPSDVGPSPDGDSCTAEDDSCDVFSSICCGSAACVAGVCAAPGMCATTCAGCCDGEVCLPGTDTDSCGSGGLACNSCTTGLLCSDLGGINLCEFDPSFTWDIVVLDAVLPQVNAGGGSWDPLNGTPDPFVQTFFSTRPATKTTTVNDTFTPTWNQVAMSGVSGQEVAADTVAFNVYDGDGIVKGGDDAMGVCTFFITVDAADGTPQEAAGCAWNTNSTDTFSLRYQLLVH